MNAPTSLGEKVKHYRKEMGFSLDKLATLAGTSKSYLWEIENRESLNPSGDLIARIAKPLGLTVDYLLSEDPALSEDIQKEALFRNFKCLSLKDQKGILQMIELWSQPI